MKKFWERIRSIEQRKLTSVLQIGIVVSIVSLFVGVFIFYAHYLQDGTKPWTSQDGELILAVFSALFAGLNVLAFIALTLAIERQNSRREEELARYDGLRFKLQRQREIGEAFRAIVLRYISPAYFEKILTKSDVLKAEVQLRQDMLSCLSILGLNFDPSLPNNRLTLFPQVAKLNWSDELGKFLEGIDEILDKYAKSEDMSKMHSEIKSYYANEWQLIPKLLIEIGEGIEKDIQKTLFESMGLSINEDITKK